MIKVHLNIQKSTLQNHHYLSHKVQRILVSQLLTPSVNAYTEFKLCLIPIPCVIAWPGALHRYLAIAAASGARPHMEGWPARHQPSSVRPSDNNLSEWERTWLCRRGGKFKKAEKPKRRTEQPPNTVSEWCTKTPQMKRKHTFLPQKKGHGGCGSYIRWPLCRTNMISIETIAGT